MNTMNLHQAGLRLDRNWTQGLALFGLLVVAVAAPFVVYPVFIMKALCFALFASAFNLLAGYGGLISFGHAAFFGSASYVTAFVVKQWGFVPELGILAGVLVAAALGLCFGYLAIRRSGIYFAMVTLALAQIVYFVCFQSPFTNGEDGIQGVPRNYLFGLFDLSNRTIAYFVVFGIFLLGFAILSRAVNSPFGVVLQAIRENEIRAISLGYDVPRYKLLAFVLSAALSGLAGSTKCLIFGVASLTDVNFGVSGEVILMTLIGGMGTLLGPPLGALVVIGLEHYLEPLGQWVIFIQGLVFVLVVLFFRAGIVGALKKFSSARASGKNTP